MAAYIAIGFFLGRYIDGKLELEKPIFALLLMVTFMVAFFYKLIKDLEKENNSGKG